MSAAPLIDLAAVRAAREAYSKAASAMSICTGRRDALLSKRDDLKRIIAAIEQANRLADVEALTLGTTPPEIPRDAARKLSMAQRALAAMPEAVGHAEADLAAARNVATTIEADLRGAIFQLTVDACEAEAANERKISELRAEGLARMAAWEAVREALVGEHPLSGISVDALPWSGKVVANAAITGTPPRLRAPSFNVDAIMGKASDIASELIAQITKG